MNPFGTPDAFRLDVDLWQGAFPRLPDPGALV
jgi:hypothetical protein